MAQKDFSSTPEKITVTTESLLLPWLMRRKVSRISRKKNRTSRLSLQQRDWKIPYNWDSFVDPLYEKEVLAVHNTIIRILEEIAILFILFLNQDACKLFEKAGCSVDFSDSKVKMHRQLVLNMLKIVPEKFSITPRNQNNEIKIGDRNLVFGNVSSPPNTLDLTRARGPVILTASKI